jgi:hypothetical protein
MQSQASFLQEYPISENIFHTCSSKSLDSSLQILERLVLVLALWVHMKNQIVCHYDLLLCRGGVCHIRAPLFHEKDSLRQMYQMMLDFVDASDEHLPG